MGIVLLTAFFILSRHTLANTTTAYFNDFESDTADWGGSGSIQRVASGTNGINSAAGNFHAVVSGNHTGPNTRFGGYGSTWTSDWETSIDIYLDPSWQAGEGF